LAGLALGLALAAHSACSGDDTGAGPPSGSLDAKGQDAGGGLADAKGDSGGQPPANAGIGVVCLKNADCAPYGLVCFEVQGGQRVCSKACTGPGDCPQGSHCHAEGQVQICTLARYCDPCQTAADCSALAPVCRPDAKGQGYCSMECNVGGGTCPGGSTCTQYGSGIHAFACAPDYGLCKGGGEHCSPCELPGDCGGGTDCITNEIDERFCAQICDPKAPAQTCPQGFACALDAAAQKGYCYKQVAKVKGGLFPTCAKGNKLFCDACTYHFECASARCASKGGDKFCVEPEPCASNADCPYGGEATFCVPSEDSGKICAPPIALHCHGYKACLGHICGGDEVCDNGLCKKR
jgi:hypothetical protein